MQKGRPQFPFYGHSGTNNGENYLWINTMEYVCQSKVIQKISRRDKEIIKGVTYVTSIKHIVIRQYF